MENKIEVPIGNNKIVAFVNNWSDGLPTEIYIALVDGNGAIFQDICMVREHYHFNKNKNEFEIDDSFVDCKVWSDSDDEDYTDEFVIGVQSEED